MEQVFSQNKRKGYCMKKVVKFMVIAFVLVGVMMGMLSGCNASKDGKDAPSNSKVVSNQDAKENSPEKVSVAFINALISKDYKAVLKAIDKDGDDSFLTENSIEFYLPRSSYSDVEGISLDSVDVAFTGYKDKTKTKVDCVVSAVNKDTESSTDFIVPCSMNKNNQWVVDGEEFYHTDFSFITASDVSIVVNGKEVPDSMLVSKTGVNDTENVCTLPCVGKDDIHIKLSCDNYTYETDISPATSNEAENADIVLSPLSDEDRKACENFIKTSFNAMYSDYLDGAKASDFNKYISSDADPDICNQILDGFKSMSNKGSSGNSNFKLSKCIVSDKTNWVSGDSVYVDFKYQLDWVYNLAKWNQNTKRLSNILLKKEDGEFKIYGLTDSGLFTECNNFTQEWE